MVLVTSDIKKLYPKAFRAARKCVLKELKSVTAGFERCIIHAGSDPEMAEVRTAAARKAIANASPKEQTRGSEPMNRAYDLQLTHADKIPAKSRENVQCPACKSYKTFAVDRRLRYCRDCKKSFMRRMKTGLQEEVNHAE